MFGLEKEKNSPGAPDEVPYDLEEDLNSTEKGRVFCDHLQQQIFHLKKALREGEKQETFDHIGTLLHGYLAMKKVVDRIKEKQKKK